MIEGQAPLLLGRPTLEKLKVQLDFNKKELQLLDLPTPLPMQTNSAGQLLLDVMNFRKRASDSTNVKCKVSLGTTPNAGCNPKGFLNTRVSSLGSQGCPCMDSSPKDSSSGSVTSRSPKPKPVLTEQVSTKGSWEPIPSPKSRSSKIPLKAKQTRCLLAQVRALEHQRESRTAAAELFSPPRFASEARKQGFTGLSFDMLQGVNLLNLETQKEVDALLDEAKPHLLTASPPCTYHGGWDHINKRYRTPVEQAQITRRSRQQVRFCVDQIHKQLKRGGHFLLEHPLGSRLWKDPEISALKQRFGFHKVDMCAYGLTCPKTGLPMQKHTGILCSHPNFRHAARRCPGCAQHQPIEGHCGLGRSRSAHAGRYTPEFVKSVWQHIGPQASEILYTPGDPIDWATLQCECLAGDVEVSASDAAPAAEPPCEGDAAEQDDAQQVARVDQALKRLHANMGHPSTKDLIRILEHSRASDLAIRRASALQCSICANQQRPSAPLPANASVVKDFNDVVGLDVKYLPGWQPQQKIPCVNCVDMATSLQVMTPITKRETGELLVDAFRDRWIAWAGPPQRLVLDPSQPNLSATFGEFCNNHGVDVQQTAAEAPWQLGKTERHGQWFQRILARVLDDMKPENEREWLSCVFQAQSAKNSLITESGASPYQLVFGRNPRVPSDLLQDSPHAPASDAADFDDLASRANAIRQSARLADPQTWWKHIWGGFGLVCGVCMRTCCRDDLLMLNDAMIQRKKRDKQLGLI